MKRVLYFAVIYAVSFLIGTLVFATLFMFSCNLTMFVTGLPGSFFSLDFFLHGVLLSVPLVCVVIQILLILYLIRHPNCQLISFVLYVVFGLFAWLLLIPADMRLIEKYESDTIISRVNTTSAGFFRKEESGVFYYSRIESDGTADGLFLDTTGSLGQEGAVLPLFNVPVKNESAFPYSDILIKNSLEPSPLVVYPLSVYNALLTAGTYCASVGFLTWLGFATLGLALLSIYGFQFLSSWKMANVSVVLTAAALVVFVNYLYYMNILPSSIKNMNARLSQFLGLTDAMIIFANIVIAFVFIVTGTFMGIYRLKGSSILESDE